MPGSKYTKLSFIILLLSIQVRGHGGRLLSDEYSEVEDFHERSRRLLEKSEGVAIVNQKTDEHDVQSLDSQSGSQNGPHQMIRSLMKPRETAGFFHAFAASVSVIVVSELGDKTFFIAAIMAMRYSRLTVFVGAITALGLMTVLSACLGFATTIIPRWITYYVSTLLFAVFGFRMLHEGINMRADEGQEELEDVQAELKKKQEELEREAKSTLTEDPESGIVQGGRLVKRCWGLVSPILFQAFTLTFLAEWGDRSQLTTIILAAREDVFGVMIGGTIGHMLCTGLAVVGGRMIAQKISVRTVTIIGGVVFILFAVSSLFISPESAS